MGLWTKLSPAHWKKLGNRRLSDIIVDEISRSRKRIAALEKRYPSADPRELAQRLIDEKKSVAGMMGGISGIFGLVSLPADWLGMVWLQLTLLIDIATLYKVNLKTEGARVQLLDLFGYANGLGPLKHSGPKVLGRLAGAALQRSGLKTVGRVLPLVAAPVTAYLNNRQIQEVGDEAVHHYSGFNKLHAKQQAAP
jgi:hypothetical protein